MGRFVGQIGVLGWIIVVPTLIGIFVGRWLDHALRTGIFWTAPIVAVGRRARLLVGLAMDAQAMTVLISPITHYCAPAAPRMLGAGALIGRLLLSVAALERQDAGLWPVAAAGVLALQLGRFALVAGVLAAIASLHGALPLLLAAAGILPLARRVVGDWRVQP